LEVISDAFLSVDREAVGRRRKLRLLSPVIHELVKWPRISVENADSMSKHVPKATMDLAVIGRAESSLSGSKGVACSQRECMNVGYPNRSYDREAPCKQA
jgi:hypothetical protein